MADTQNEWQTQTGLSREEFERFTRYCNQSDNGQDNRNRAEALGFTAAGVKIAPGAIIRIGENQPGAHSFVGLYTYVNGDVTIGTHVLIGPHCSLTAGDHKFDPEDGWFSKRTPKEGSRILIGDGTWIAAGCTVTSGVAVGRCNLICANAVVTRDTEDYAIIAGTPGRQIGSIDPDTGEYVWSK